MKILTQDRAAMIEIPDNLYITIESDRGLVMCTGRVSKCIGEYESTKRAMEVLGEIFRYYRNGKNSYVMPTE